MGHSNLLSLEQADSLRTGVRATLPAGMDVSQARLCVRPEALQLTRQVDGPGRVLDVTFVGSLQRVRVRWMDKDLLAETSNAMLMAPGDAVEPVSYTHLDVYKRQEHRTLISPSRQLEKSRHHVFADSGFAQDL